MPSDITENEMNFEMLSRLGRRLAHELNNPISAITSSVYLIQDIAADGTVNGEDIEPFLTSIQEECTRMKETVQEFSKFASTTSILPARIDLSEFVQKRVEEMQRDGLSVTAEVPNAQFYSEADPGALSLVLRPIAESALNAGASEVTVSLSSNAANAIAVSDNRSPKPPIDELSSSFSSDGTLEKRHGLGLKLPLARRIVELHGGSIEFPSTPNERTEVRIHLPRSKILPNVPENNSGMILS